MSCEVSRAHTHTPTPTHTRARAGTRRELNTGTYDHTYASSNTFPWHKITSELKALGPTGRAPARASAHDGTLWFRNVETRVAPSYFHLRRPSAFFAGVARRLASFLPFPPHLSRGTLTFDFNTIFYSLRLGWERYFNGWRLSRLN